MTLLVTGPMLLLGACGSPARAADPPPSRRPSPPGATLCRSVVNLNRLVVRRSDAFPQNQMRFSFPAEVTVTAAGNVREAARTLCALPRMPSGTFHCPANFGIAYHLVFSAGDQAFPRVEVDASGCQVVHGLGAVRWAARSPELWPTLGAAMGIPSPSYATFRSSGPNG